MMFPYTILTATIAGFIATMAVCTGKPVLDLRIEPVTGKPKITYHGVLGGEYKLQRSPDLLVWENLSPSTPGRNRTEELTDNTISRQCFYRIESVPPPLFDIVPLRNFCAVGDSITDRSTFNQPAIYDGLGYDLSGWGAMLEQLSGGRIRSVARSNAFKTDRDHGYSGITSWMFRDGGGWLPAGLIPIEDAVASKADCFIVHIGTNDIASSTPQEIVSRIQRIWSRLVQTGKPVIGTDILQRCATYPGWTPELRDRVTAVNSALRATWKTQGLASYRPWDHLIEKDDQGFAISAEFPNDGVHPTMRVGLKLGNDLHQLLNPFYVGIGDLIPAKDSPVWLTPNPAVSGTAGLANSWIPMSLGVADTDVIYTKLSDTEGDWQRIKILNPQSQGTRGVYTRQVGAGNTWNVGDRCVATMRVRVPPGTTFSGIGISVQCVGASSPWIDAAAASHTYVSSPIEDFDATIVSNPFTIPNGTTELWFLLKITGGAGTVDFRQAGIFRIDL
jgi:hypothetical protein